MNSEGHLEAVPIKKILDARTGKVVGWLYLWNNGEVAPMWIADEPTDEIFPSFSRQGPAEY